MDPERYRADHEAELAARFGARLRLFAARHLSDAAAEDVAQETLRRVLEALRAGRVENLSALPAFALRTAHHLCLQQQRSAARESRALHRVHDDGPHPALPPDPLAVLVREERRTAVRDALARLADGERELLRMLYYEEAGTELVARRLGIKPGAVRVRKHRALRHLGERLGEGVP